MSSLQEALALALATGAKPAKPAAPIKPAIQPARRKSARPPSPVERAVLDRRDAAPSGVHRVPLFTLAERYPLRPAVIEHERHSKSAPPPQHEPNFSERYFT